MISGNNVLLLGDNTMNMLNAVILGLVQGIAEFLPISSSGHLSLFEHLLGIGGLAALDENALFNVLLHLATLVAVIIAYWSDVRDMLVEFFRMLAGKSRAKDAGTKPNIPMRRQLLMMFIATLPLVLVVPVHNKVEMLSAYPWVIGIMLVLTGFLLFASDRMPKGTKNEKTMTVADALIIGLCQAVATIPGLSRSGTTITAGMSRKLERPYAVKFSFLISLLSVAGAVLLKVVDVIKDGADMSMLPCYLVGMVIAGVVGYASIRLLQKIVSKGRFGGFAWYCWIVGALAIIISLIKG